MLWISDLLEYVATEVDFSAPLSMSLCLSMFLPLVFCYLHDNVSSSFEYSVENFFTILNITLWRSFSLKITSLLLFNPFIWFFFLFNFLKLVWFTLALGRLRLLTIQILIDIIWLCHYLKVSTFKHLEWCLFMKKAKYLSICRIVLSNIEIGYVYYGFCRVSLTYHRFLYINSAMCFCQYRFLAINSIATL